MIRSGVPHYQLDRLTPAERVELAELQQAFARDPSDPRLARLNILQARATAEEHLRQPSRRRMAEAVAAATARDKRRERNRQFAKLDEVDHHARRRAEFWERLDAE